MKALLVVLGVVLVAACDDPPNRISEAAALVVQDLVPRAPTGFEPYLAARWASGSEEEIPAELLSDLLEASGLEVAPPGMMESGDSTVIILYLLPPMVSDGDTVRVLGGWMGLVGGDGGGGWGDEFSYRLDCSRNCRILGLVGSGSWN